MNEMLQNIQKGILLPICLIIACCFLGISNLALAAHSDHATENNSFSLFGKVPPNQIYFGMFTYHFDPKSLGTRNWNNHLLALQIDGVFIGTLMNSFYKRSWAIGISREVYRKNLNVDWSFTTGYRVGLVDGYENQESIFNTDSDVIPFIDIHGQFTYLEHLGVELMLTSSLSACFFYQF